MITVDSLPTFTEPAPSRSMDEAQFAAAADNFASELTAFVPNMNTIIGQINQLSDELLLVASMNSIEYTFNAVYAVPAAGELRMNGLNQNISTEMYLHNSTFAGLDVTTLLRTFDDAPDTVKGTLYVLSVADPTKKLVFNVNSLADGGTYVNLQGATVGFSGTNPFTDGERVLATFYTRSAVQSETFASAQQSLSYTQFTAAGGPAAYTLTPTPAITGAYASHVGKRFQVKLPSTPTTPSSATLNISGLGALNLRKWSPVGLVALETGDVLINQTLDVMIYDATTAVVLNPVVNGLRMSRGSVGMSGSTALNISWGAAYADAVTEFDAVCELFSTSGSSQPLVRMLTGSGATTTGYDYSYVTPGNGIATVGSSATGGAGSGIPIASSVAAASSLNPRVRGKLIDKATHTWGIEIIASVNGSGILHISGGTVTLPSAATGFQFTATNGTDVIDAGTVGYDIRF
jgi:hypothetical protein